MSALSLRRAGLGAGTTIIEIIEYERRHCDALVSKASHANLDRVTQSGERVVIATHKSSLQ